MGRNMLFCNLKHNFRVLMFISKLVVLLFKNFVDNRLNANSVKLFLKLFWIYGLLEASLLILNPKDF